VAACRAAVFAIAAVLAGCAVPAQKDSALLDNMTEMQIRMRLLQSELDSLRETLASRDMEQARSSATDEILRNRLDDLQASVASLPAEVAELCPPPSAAALNTQCENAANVQRVVVSGDKLVVGQLERIWLEPPAVSLVAAINAGVDASVLNVTEIVEFERDGNKWVRFNLPLEEPVTVERALKRTERVGGSGPRQPVVDLRVQLGDVRESVEFALIDAAEAERMVVLGRNFLTDVALLDVARTYVQPAFTAPND
jgi:hypothetical protein